MVRQKLLPRDVPGLLAELEASGVTDVRRSPVDMDGLVEVQWNESELERQQYAADLKAWRPAIALSAAFAAFVVVVLLVLTL